MKSILRFGCGVLLLAAVLTSCKNTVSKEAKYIPKEATMVFVVDAGQMQDKLQKGGISTDSLIARLFKNEPADSKDRAEFNEARTNAGIDWEKKWFFFMIQKALPDKSMSTTFSVLGSLKDAAKLEAYLKKQEDLKTKPIQKETDYSYLLAKDNTLFAWNKEQVIITFYSHASNLIGDTAAVQMDQPKDVDETAALKAQVAKYFTQKTSESLADQSIFIDMFKEKADGYVFTNTNNAPGYLRLLPMQVPKLEEFIKDNYSTTTLHFEEGKIVARGTSYPNPIVSNLIKQYSGPAVNLSLLEKYPSANLNGFMLFAVNPEIIGGLLKQLEIEGFANIAMQKTGLTPEDIYKAFKGDFAVMVSDIGMMGIEPQLKTDEKSMISKRPWGKMIVNLPVGDKTSFDKVMGKGVEMGGLVKTLGGYKGSQLLSSIGLFIQADEKNLVIASDSLTYTQYMAGASKAVIGKDIMDKFSGGKSAIMYFDIAKTLNTLAKDSVGSYHNSLLTARQTFKDAIGVVNSFDGKTLKSSFEVRLQDEKQNSLVTLTRLFTDIAVDMRVQARIQDSKLFPGGVPAIIRTN
ncbi:DUF4836 family protein [Sediminibacterium soli]|uniref:DUF4836 family protein n=1 Tax=Sediminibacterium soli TaxID=2698829 RepID=UPI00137B63CA|nr:DUF4836 family protein [Sediminibacterium soli]NCI47618.1 DUF4836 family protein [Sediminibacterium soli]